MSNIETVRQMYVAFARKDIALILSRLSETVEWQYGGNSTDAPWQELRRGRAEVPKYFEALGLLEIRRLEPKTFLESGLVVTVLIDAELVVKANGNRIVEEDAVHIWRFDEQGQVVRFRNRADTLLHQRAYKGSL
jgi:ketosteroid isomerase-like protein